MAKSVIVYGPQRSDKTLHSAAIAERLGLRQVIDLEDVKLMGERLQREGFLYLSCSESYAHRAASLLGSRVIHIEQALAAIGIENAEVARG